MDYPEFRKTIFLYTLTVMDITFILQLRKPMRFLPSLHTEWMTAKSTVPKPILSDMKIWIIFYLYVPVFHIIHIYKTYLTYLMPNYFICME